MARLAAQRMGSPLESAPPTSHISAVVLLVKENERGIRSIADTGDHRRRSGAQNAAAALTRVSASHSFSGGLSAGLPPPPPTPARL